MKRLTENFCTVARDLATVPVRVYTASFRGLQDEDGWTPVGAAVGSAVMGTAALGMGALAGATWGLVAAAVTSVPTMLVAGPSEFARVAVVGTGLVTAVTAGLAFVASELMLEDGYPRTVAWQKADAAKRDRSNQQPTP